MSNQQPRAEETRTRLLEAAAECFAQRGYDAAGVAEICRRAKVSKGAFYHHFTSKHALFLEMLNVWLAGVDEQLDMARLAAATIPEAILGMVEQAGPIFQMAEEYIPLYLEFYNQASRDPVVWQTLSEPYRRYQAFFAQLIEIGIQEGSFRPMDAGVTARVLLALAVGLLLQSLFNPDEEDWAQVAREGVKIILKGLEGAKDNNAP